MIPSFVIQISGFLSWKIALYKLKSSFYNGAKPSICIIIPFCGRQQRSHVSLILHPSAGAVFTAFAKSA
ncbi:hypothetical protein AB434_2867 [Heyndrickxia coagulans]|uniref:Uncharacterized protein n=1 Tax=Heyndrickxia coagulans TaxID=1398 RepID=A0A0C5CCH2_HEYCO|nr:hypothetical protein SB48_HM08orf03856 [Heyndrickxia coagulans]KGT39740.1 hypothetical protein P421_03625 [Heyndrickxia coagulans P38]AKN55272.1 hypothetical protein AB434_2867 [Heyndrickxia coagulans]APB35995.1 hypothetical protein BIZ35_03680 [Heyndrickxia coagulans]ATW83386.1 hypothetical protein CIW84_10530 [Heyndrickxia coagulans]